MLRPTVQEANGSWRLIRGFRNSSYRRMHPARPAATITTASGQIGSDRTLHPWENRVLSPAECSFLQTIPDTFQWGDSMDKYGHTPVRQMIGEAVPPRFTTLHGQVLAALALGKDLPDTLSQQDSRCLKAHAKLG
ncbi:MAG: DNA cytosine methyltransferase [Bacteroidota bacterium]|nr:DNA cytosine methyltransferase [Bacteroidota bacterium]